MANKLRRAVRAWAQPMTMDTWKADQVLWSEHNCYIVPAAEYERLTRKSTKAAKRGRRGK